jgi:hypothetical protein
MREELDTEVDDVFELRKDNEELQETLLRMWKALGSPAE